MTAFATVGTTRFDGLCAIVDTVDFQHQLVQLGFTRMIVQYGKSMVPPQSRVDKLFVESVDFVPDIKPFILASSLVLSHGGSGTILEVLRSPNTPKLLVLVNDKLMDNHQIELAGALDRDGYALSGHPSDLLEMLSKINSRTFRQFPASDSSPFRALLDELV